MKKTPKKIVHVAMPLELYEQLYQLGKKTCRTVPGYIRQILKCYVRYLEDDLDAQSKIGSIKIPWPVSNE